MSENMDPDAEADEKDYTALFAQIKADNVSTFMAEQSDIFGNSQNSDIFEISSADVVSRQRLNENTQENLFYCEICKKYLSSKSSLSSHMKIHMKEKPFKCSWCGKQFIFKHRLTDHIDHIHKGKDHQSEICHKSFARKDGLLEHFKRKHIGERKFSCTSCTKSFVTKSELKKHYKNKHPDKMQNKCNECGNCFSDENTLFKHECEHARIPKDDVGKPYKCAWCEKQYRFKHHLTAHVDYHHNGKRHLCEICQKSFTSKDGLQQHNRRIHTGKRKFTCTICMKSYVRKCELKGHYESKHSVEMQNMCDECGHCFPNENTLLTHECEHAKIANDNTDKTQDPPPSFITPDDVQTTKPAPETDEEECSAEDTLISLEEQNSFSRKSDEISAFGKSATEPDKRDGSVENPFSFMDEQSSIRGNSKETTAFKKSEKDLQICVASDQEGNKSMNESSFRCEICHKNLSSKSSLFHHMRIHQEEKPFKCSLCEKQFTFNHRLTEHIDHYHKGKALECKICQKSFTRKDGLHAHYKRKHNGEKKFTCAICMKSYVRKCELKRHYENKHSGEIQNKCDKCGHHFPDENTLLAHECEHDIITDDRNKTETQKYPFSYLTPADCKTKDSTFVIDKITKILHQVKVENPVSFMEEQIQNNCHECGHCLPDKNALFTHECELSGNMDYLSKNKTEKLPSSCGTSNDHAFTADEIDLPVNIRQFKVENPLSFVEEQSGISGNSDGTSTFKTFEKHLSTFDDSAQEDKQNIQESSFPCKICQKNLFTESSLVSHMRIHLEEKAFKCSWCEKQFTFKHQLTAHIDHYHKEKDHFNEISQTSSTRKDGSEEHCKMKHNGEKKFSCAICMKPYVRKCELKKHYENQHSGEIQNKCAEWGLCFPDENRLLTHDCESNRTIDDLSKNKTQEHPFSCMSPLDKTTNDRTFMIDDTNHAADICRIKPENSSSFVEKHSSISGNSDETFQTDDIDFTAKLNQVRAKNDSSSVENCSILENENSTSLFRKSSIFKQSFSEYAMLDQKEKEKMKKTSFHCRICKKALSSRRSFTQHILTIHLGVKPYKCSECEKRFTVKHYLTAHMEHIHRGIKSFVCKICKKSYTTKEGLNMHNKRKHGERKHRCTDCGKSFARRCELILHYKKKHSLQSGHRCFQCLQWFSDRITYLIHECKQTGIADDHCDTQIRESAFSCEICKKTFGSKNVLEYHMRTHLPEKQYKCSLCGKQFNSRSDLTDHMDFHHSNERNYVCQICGKCYVIKDSLRQHFKLKHMHNGNGGGHFKKATKHRSFSCELCNKTFKSRQHIKDHVKTHLKEKDVQCSECGKLFTSKVGLHTHHERKHSGEKQHLCFICLKSYVTIRLLNQHFRIKHKGDNNNQITCVDCRCKFPDKDSLVSHECKHKGSTNSISKTNAQKSPVTCDICKKVISSKYNLITHMKIHQNEKAFECQLCSKQFTYNSSLKAHMAYSHLKRRDFLCHACGKSFITQSDLRFHFKKRNH